ncbi:MAG: MarC family protein [Alsobacter sp.]
MALFAISLLALFSPPATLGPAASILAGAPAKAQKRVAFLVARNYALILVVALLLGHALLRLLGITTAALTLTGGAALVHQGWPLMTRGDKAADRSAAGGDALDRNWDQISAVPLTFPITIGGGTIAVAVSASGRYPTLPDLAVLATICLSLSLAVYLTFRLAGPVTSRLGEGAMDAITRASGIVLVALGAQLSVAGLVGLTLSNLHLPH